MKERDRFEEEEKRGREEEVGYQHSQEGEAQPALAEVPVRGVAGADLLVWGNK